MVIDKYKEEQAKLEEEERRKNGGPEEEKETMTLQEIISNHTNSDLFGKMLDTEGNPSENKALMERLAKGELKADDLDGLESHRKLFEERMNRVENVDEELTEEMVIEIGESNPDIKKIISLSKSGDVVKAVGTRLAELAMTDPDHFNEIAGKIERMQAVKRGGDKLDESINGYCKENGISGDEVAKLYAIGNESERKTALADLVRDSWGSGLVGKLKRAFDRGDGSIKTVEQLESYKKKIDTILVTLDKRKRDIGTALATTISGNEVMLKALANAIKGEPTKVEKGLGFKEAGAAMMKDEEVENEWEKRKADVVKNLGVANWAAVPNKINEADKFVADMEAEVKKRSRGGGSFWAKIFSPIFHGFMFDKKHDLN